MKSSRDAWLSAFATALGVAVASCKREAPPDPAVVAREVAPSATPSIVASATPAPSASVAEIADASSPADASPQKTAATAPSVDFSGIGGLNSVDASMGVIGTLGHLRVNNSCGASMPVNPSCGASVQREPTANVSVAVVAGQEGTDAQKVQTLRASLRACANKGLEQNPGMSGTVRVQVQVDAKGDATSTVNGLGGVEANVGACMAAKLRNLKFDAGSPRTLQVVVTMTSQN